MQIKIPFLPWTGRADLAVEIDAEFEGKSRRVQLGMAVKIVIGNKAVLRGADLSGADLSGADLSGADLSGAVLRDADLRDADLRDADLSDAVLRGADLSGADLSGAVLRDADLRDADLSGADLSDADLSGDLKLIGERPILFIGPIGSESRTISAFLTDKGLRIRAGCFFGDLDQFKEQLQTRHGDNEHAREYRAALVLIEAHAEIWAPVAAADLNQQAAE